MFFDFLRNACLSPLEKCLLKYSAYFQLGFSAFFLLICECPLYILYKSFFWICVKHSVV